MWGEAQSEIPEKYVENDIPFFPEDQAWVSGSFENNDAAEYDAAFERELAALEAEQTGAAENETVTESATTEPSESGQVTGPISQSDNRSEAEEADPEALENHKMVAKMLGRMNGRPGKKVVPPSQRRNADALFKDPIKIGSGPSFDEETYKKALPYFRAAAAHFKDAASDISQMVALMALITPRHWWVSWAAIPD